MSEEQLAGIGGAIAAILAAALAAFRVGLRRGSNGASNRWAQEDRDLVIGLREHISELTESIGDLRSSVDRMSGFIQGRFSGSADSD